MESELEDENKNVNSTSFIITPYNSMINEYYDDIYYEDLRIEDNIMRFVPKVNELNREYEIKNNEDVDQGFIINKKDQKVKNKIMLSFNDLNEVNNYDNKKELPALSHDSLPTEAPAQNFITVELGKKVNITFPKSSKIADDMHFYALFMQKTTIFRSLSCFFTRKFPPFKKL